MQLSDNCYQKQSNIPKKTKSEIKNFYQLEHSQIAKYLLTYKKVLVEKQDPQDIDNKPTMEANNSYEDNTYEYQESDHDHSSLYLSYEEEHQMASEHSYSQIQLDSLKYIVLSLILNTAQDNNLTSGRALKLLSMVEYNPNSISSLTSFNQLPSFDSKISSSSSRRRQKRKSTKPLSPCLICLNNQDLKCLQCNHLICQTCWNTNLTDAITCTSKKDNLIGKTCLIEGCNELISLEFIKEIVTNATYERYLNILAEDYAQKMKFIQCRNHECDSFFQLNTFLEYSTPVSMFCKCGTTCCSSCLQEAHSPMSCILFLDLLENTKRFLSVLDSQNLPDTKQCPSCGILMEVDVKCFETTCICGYDINQESVDEINLDAQKLQIDKEKIKGSLTTEIKGEVRLYQEQKRAIEQIKQKKLSYERQEKDEFYINPIEISVGFIQNVYESLIENASFSSYTRLGLLNVPITEKKQQKMALVSLEKELQTLSDKIEDYRKIVEFHRNQKKKVNNQKQLLELEQGIIHSISQVGDLKRNLSSELKKLRVYQRQKTQKILPEEGENVLETDKLIEKMDEETDKHQDNDKKQFDKQVQEEESMKLSQIIIMQRKGENNQLCKQQMISNNSRLKQQGNKQQQDYSKGIKINGYGGQKINKSKIEIGSSRYCNSCLKETKLFYLCESCRELLLRK